jgi:hypothetical protein
MRRVPLRRPSPAMIVACLALLVALGGTSVAAVNALPTNSVGTAQLKASAVTNPKIAANAVNSLKVLNGSLVKADFKAGQLPAGPQGPPGPQGQPGAQGPQGVAGVIGPVTVRTSTITVPGGIGENGAYNTLVVTSLCQTGELAISGSGSWSDQDNNLELVVVGIEPVVNASNEVIGFSGRGGNDSGQSSTFRVHSLCYKK